MIDKMIIDADLCMKLGSSNKYAYLYDILPRISKEIYMHRHTYSEVMMPESAVRQLRKLVNEQKVQIVSEEELPKEYQAIFNATYAKLARVMIDPRRPNKNKGEVCALAYAKTAHIPVFATDEKDLQAIIDMQLNTGIGTDITCIRIVDIITKAHNTEIDIPRKVCKALWVMAGKRKEVFDEKIWPLMVGDK